MLVSARPAIQSADKSALAATVARVFAFFLLSILALPVLEVSSAAASETGDPRTVTATPCGVEEPAVDPATDIHAMTKYETWLSDLLKAEHFSQLDCIARAVRKDKSRFVGGDWKIHKFYVAMYEPNPGMHATQEDWDQHLALAKKWVAASPDSVAARIALARSYTNYAWFARGNGMAGTVSDSGWKQFESRMIEAETILNQASSLNEKDPEWYVVMQMVALGEQWQPNRAIALFEQATAFEPTYFYYHWQLANYLLPKWYGEEGDTSSFLTAAADKMKGPEGDGMYFLMATQVACGCDEPEFTRLSWPRLLSGFRYVEKNYGVSMEHLNKFALMAVKFNDPLTASDAFARIGDNWDMDTWHSEQFFKGSKEFAQVAGENEKMHRAAVKQAEDNASTPQGAQYQKTVQRTFLGFMPTCADAAKKASAKYDMFLQVGNKGDMKGLYLKPDAPPDLTGCLMTQLMTPRPGNTMPLPVPPGTAPYWVKVEVDPMQVQASIQ